MIRLFNIDLHISVIADVTHVLKDIYGDAIDITNWSISGHDWVFGKPTADIKVFNQHTWKNIDEKMIQEFVEYYRDELTQYDGFIVTHTPVLALLYETFNKPIIVVNSCRYEQPYSWKRDIDGWEWLNSKFRNMKNVHFISNNKADQEYLKLGTGIESKHIPSLCLYTGHKYTGAFSEKVIQHGTYPVRYTWQWLYNNKAIVHVPYEISTMSIFEQYSANVPLFFPTKRFLREMQTLKSVYGPLHPNLRVCADMNWWIERADYYDLPHIIYFDNEEELNEKIKTLDFQQISKNMETHNNFRKERVYQQWREVIEGIEDWADKLNQSDGRRNMTLQN